MGRWAITLAGVLVLALLAGGLTEVTLAVGSRNGTTNDSLVPHVQMAKSSPSVSPHPSASPTPMSLSTPAVTPTPTPAESTATTNSFVHLRAAESTSSDILANLNGGTVVQLLPVNTGTWQEVEYNGVTGFIFEAYLTY